jgi:Ca-activated chloride channel family protein
VGWLLDEIRMHGESDELKKEIVSLARKYGIVTPYTAYLIIEDERRRGVPMTSRSFREMEKDRDVMDKSTSFYGSTGQEAKDEKQQSGSQAVTNAGSVAQLKTVDNTQTINTTASSDAMAKATPTTQAAGGGGGYRQTNNYVQQARVVNGRSFYQNDGAWTDSTIQSNDKLKHQQIKLGSDEYFKLMKDHPEAAAWLALGEQVDVAIGDTVYSIR